MLGATLTNMDAGLNKGVGVFIRSFYLPVINPHCSEKKLLILSKVSTLTFGILIVSFALLVNKFRTADLFTFVNQVAASLSIPLALPLFLGLFYKRTPPWSAWSTGLLGILISLFINFYLKYHFVDFVHRPLNQLEADNLLFAVTIFGTFFPCTAWFFFTTVFYDSSPREDKERVEEFFERLRTPVLTHPTRKSETAIHHLLGLLCIVFGGFIALLMLIPNNLLGRSCFLFCGGSLLLTGSILEYLHRRHREK
jgi:Na+/proline symporter